MIVDIADLDVIYLSFDEPLAEEFWAQINAMVPWAKRVHGIRGFDAAHKAAAAVSDTDRFVLIDGDNIPDDDFFNQQLRLTPINEGHVFRWKARNIINGLCYGNGGISCWTKKFVEEMRSHEAAIDTSDLKNSVEFCWNDGYVAMHNIYSTTYPNGSKYQAWKAGYREGVKLSLNQGSYPQSIKSVHPENLDRLMKWLTIGQDVDNGIYAIVGAHMGVLDVSNKSHTDISEFSDLLDHYTSFRIETEDSVEQLKSMREELRVREGLEIPDLNAMQSWFFKSFIKEEPNRDIMLTEVEARK